MPADFVSTETDSNGDLVIVVQTADPEQLGSHEMVLIVTMASNYAVLEQPFTVRIVDCVVTDVEVVAEQPIAVLYEYGGEKRIPLPEIKPTPDFCTVGFDF